MAGRPLASILFVLAISACGGPTSTTQDITVELRTSGGMVPSEGKCVTDNDMSFTFLAPVPVVLTNESGTTIGSGTLTDLPDSGTGDVCHLGGTIKGVAKANFYTIAVRDVKATTTSYDDLKAANWVISLGSR